MFQRRQPRQRRFHEVHLKAGKVVNHIGPTKSAKLPAKFRAGSAAPVVTLGDEVKEEGGPASSSPTKKESSLSKAGQEGVEEILDSSSSSDDDDDEAGEHITATVDCSAMVKCEEEGYGGGVKQGRKILRCSH